MRDQYIWRKQASEPWLRANKTELLAGFAERLAVIERVGRKRTTVEICCAERRDVARLARKFGGKFAAIPRSFPQPSSKPLKIGARLVITNVGGASVPRLVAGNNSRSRHKGRSHIPQGPQLLVIPAESAFGTGAHATTAMCLRMLERISRHWPDGWNMLDAGTGSGILALSARMLGAEDAVAIDSDPHAIAIAKGNARLNRFAGIKFEIADATKHRTSKKFDVITVNLFSELLIRLIPLWRRHLKPAGVLILSGILRNQEHDVIRSLKRSKFAMQEIRRRGKWVALLARRQKAG